MKAARVCFRFSSPLVARNAFRSPAFSAGGRDPVITSIRRGLSVSSLTRWICGIDDVKKWDSNDVGVVSADGDRGSDDIARE
jgi:hypothetical protein